MKNVKLFGLIGFPLEHSFSSTYFNSKFENEKLLGYQYLNFPISNIGQLPGLLTNNPNLMGLNVTIPYKQAVIPFLHNIDSVAKEIGAVNTIKIAAAQRQLTGYNTDVIGFEQSFWPLLKPHHTHALILGSGGACRAVQHVLKSIGIIYLVISREPQATEYGYDSITAFTLRQFTVIINCTPLGMFPNATTAPHIPYEYLTPQHLCYDLVYNPAETLFLKKAKEKGAATFNGLAMLQGQAEAAWKIWCSED